MSTKHTPGPWSQDQYGTIITANGNTLRVSGVALPCGIDASRDETKANARLIAAAPDLLEALKDAVQQLAFLKSIGVQSSTIDAEIRKSRAAIAKATGEKS